MKTEFRYRDRNGKEIEPITDFDDIGFLTNQYTFRNIIENFIVDHYKSLFLVCCAFFAIGIAAFLYFSTSK